MGPIWEFPYQAQDLYKQVLVDEHSFRNLSTPKRNIVPSFRSVSVLKSDQLVQRTVSNFRFKTNSIDSNFESDITSMQLLHSVTQDM